MKKNPILLFKEKSLTVKNKVRSLGNYVFEEGLSYSKKGTLLIEKSGARNGNFSTLITETREQIDKSENS